MEQKKKWPLILGLFAVVLAVALHYLCDPWGFYWKVSSQEAALRLQMVQTAQGYLGYNEQDGSHQAIIDRYNAHEPLAMGYPVKYSDSWCDAFVSTVSIECGFTGIIPTECSCQRHIQLFQELNRWEEQDNAIPLPGDLIFYNWDAKGFGDNTGWSDHVGIVIGTKWPFVKAIEGNKDDSVSCRILFLGDPQIRGYAKPDYSSLVP